MGDEVVSRVALGAARVAGRVTARAGKPITICPYPAGPLRFAFVDAYLQAAPPKPGTVDYDETKNRPMLKVFGYVDGVAYGVTVGQPREDAAATVGVMSGSPGVCSLLRIRDGEPVDLPDGRTTILDVTDPDRVLEALTAWTEVVRVVDDQAVRS